METQFCINLHFHNDVTVFDIESTQMLISIMFLILRQGLREFGVKVVEISDFGGFWTPPLR